MNLFNKLAKQNLKLNKKRTIATIIGIALSVALLTSVNFLFESGVKSLSDYVKKVEGNFHLSRSHVQIDDVKKIKNNRNIESVSLIKLTGFAEIDSKNKNKPFAAIQTLTKDSLKNLLASSLADGRLPENENEIVIPTDYRSQTRSNLKIGDTITLNVGDLEHRENTAYGCIVNSSEKTYKIVGTINKCFSMDHYSYSLNFINCAEEDSIQGYVDIYTRFAKTVKNDKEMIKIVDDILETNSFVDPDEGVFRDYNIRINKYVIDVDRFSLVDLFYHQSRLNTNLLVVLVSMLAIIIFVSIFCISNSFKISVVEKLKHYGMLKSIGATRKQIKKSVFREASILGIIAVPLGILLGFIATFTLISLSNPVLSKFVSHGDTPLKLSFSFSIIALVASILLGIVTIYFAALRSCRKAAKVSTIDLIRNSAEININPKKVKTSKFIKKIFSIGGEIAYKNLKRNRKKYRVSVISIVVSVSIFIIVHSFIRGVYDFSNASLHLPDYNLSLYMSNDYYTGNDLVHPEKVEISDEELNKYIKTTELENIENYTILRMQYIFFDINNDSNLKYTSQCSNGMMSGSLKIFALGEKPYKKYIQSLGLEYDSIKDKAILMNYPTITRREISENGELHNKSYEVTQQFDIKEGEKILVNCNQEGLKLNFNCEIGKITDKIPFGTSKEGYEEASAFVILSDELFNEFFPDNKIGTILYKSNNVEKLKEDIEKSLEGELYEIQDLEERDQKLYGLPALINIFLYGFLVVIFLIAITNIFNVITANMQLRNREFATLKSVGMTNKEFTSMIRVETLLMSIKSLIFGLIIGISISYILNQHLISNSYSLSIKAILISIFAVFALIAGIMKYSMSKINKQNIIETIRNENA